MPKEQVADNYTRLATNWDALTRALENSKTYLGTNLNKDEISCFRSALKEAGEAQVNTSGKLVILANALEACLGYQFT